MAKYLVSLLQHSEYKESMTKDRKAALNKAPSKLRRQSDSRVSKINTSNNSLRLCDAQALLAGAPASVLAILNTSVPGLHRLNIFKAL